VTSLAIWLFKNIGTQDGNNVYVSGIYMKVNGRAVKGGSDKKAPDARGNTRHQGPI
jgi:hypothetical protein